ncbi:MAG: OadG family protein [Chloroflexi bacterium]|nr:OadG family protein [Chloroflexota bacterium]
MGDFGLGVQVTLWGMGLVFLTLILVAIIIWALDRIFRPKPTAEEEKDEDGAVATVEAPEAVVPQVSLANEATAIAVVLALEMQRTVKQPAAKAAQPFFVPKSDEEIVGEVVTVITADPGPAVWKSYGRLRSTI